MISNYLLENVQTPSVQLLSCVWLFSIPWIAACQASLSITQLLELTQTHVHQGGDDIQPSHLLLSPSPPTFNLGVFSNESVLCNRWPKYWEFQLQHQVLPMNIQDWFPLGCIKGTFRLDLLAVQGTLKSLLQHHSSKASILWCSAFFIVQLSHHYMTTGKTIAD